MRGGAHSNWELYSNQILPEMESTSENQKISRKICEIPTHRKVTRFVKRRTSQVLEFSPPRFASRLAGPFPSGRQAALRALTKRVQLAAPTIASQVRGHAGQTMQEWIMKIWGSIPTIDEMLLLLGGLLCMLMDVDTKKLSKVCGTLASSCRI